MYKNMTRKGLAFGAGAALVSSAFIVAPATAAVDDTAVSLTPLTGTQYSMVVDGVFDLQSTQSVAATAGSGDLKYLVTDEDEISLFDYQADTTVTSGDTNMASVDFDDPTSDILTIAYNATTDVVTIDDPAQTATPLFTNLAVGDIIQITGMDSASIDTAFSGWVEVASVEVDLDTFTFELPGLDADTFSTEDLSAGVFVEASDDEELDSYDVIVAGSLGVAGVTELAAPTRETDGSYVINTGADADATTTDVLRLVATGAGSVTVQAWIDENGNGEIDSTESASSIRTVTFVTWANSGAELNITTPVAGEDWEVWVEFASTINASQIVSTRLDVALGVLEDGALEAAVDNTTVASDAFSAATDSLVWDSASHVEDYWGFVGEVDMNVDGSPETDFVAGYTYAGQIFLDGEAYGEVIYTNIGAAVADTVGAIAATKTHNVLQSGQNIKVRSEYTGDVEMKVLLTENDSTIASAAVTGIAGDIPVAAGTAVTVKVAEGSGDLDADSTVTAGGEELATGDDPIEFTVLTDANGYAVFNLSNDQGEAGDDLDITVTHAGTAVTANVTWNDPTAANSDLSGSTVVSIEAEDEFSIEYTAVDEFGAPLAGPTYRVEVQYYEEVGGDQATTGVQLDANGKGTITIEDASSSPGTYAINADLQKLNTSAAYADFGTPEEVDTTVYVSSDITPANITLVDTADAAAGDPAIELVPGKVIDTRAPNSPSAPAYEDDEEYTISGVVTNAAGAAVRGTPVTISAPGLLFNTGALNTSTAQNYTIGSITVTTSSTGAYSVEVRSNLAGDHVVTVTAGTATETETITFDEALEATATQLSISAPSYVLPGSSFSVTVSLKDMFGNPVETSTTNAFKLSYTGGGIALSVPSDTDSEGEATFAVLLGAGDTVPGVILATYDGDATTTTVDNNLSATKTVAIGAAPSDTKVNAGSFKGYVAVYAKGYEGQRLSAKIGNDWVIVPSLASNFERVVDFTGAGVDIAVRIYIDRVLIDTINLVTK